MWWKIISILTLLPQSGIFISSANKSKTLRRCHMLLLPLFFVCAACNWVLFKPVTISTWRDRCGFTVVLWVTEKGPPSACEIKATKPKEKVTVLVLFKVGQNYCLYQSVWFKSKMNCKTQLRSVLKLTETSISLQMFNKTVFLFNCLASAHKLRCCLLYSKGSGNLTYNCCKSIGSLAE